MKVIVIEEEDHGMIGVAKDVKSAVHFLIKDCWIGEDDSLETVLGTWDTISDIFGENWKNILLNMSIDRFNCYFDGWIHFTEEEIYDIDKFIKRIK